MTDLLSSPWSSRSHLPPLTSSNPSPALSLPSPCPLKQGACCDVVTRRRGQLHGRFSAGLFSAPDVQSASICHCFPMVPLGKMGLILQSISRRVAFVLSRAPRGPIYFTAPSLELHFTFCLIYVLMVLHPALVMSPFQPFSLLFLCSLTHFLWGVVCLPCLFLPVHPCSLTLVTLLAQPCLWQSWAIKRRELDGNPARNTGQYCIIKRV